MINSARTPSSNKRKVLKILMYSNKTKTKTTLEELKSSKKIVLKQQLEFPGIGKHFSAFPISLKE